MERPEGTFTRLPGWAVEGWLSARPGCAIGRTTSTMLSKRALARAAAITGALTLYGASLPFDAVLAQQSPVVALEQARKGEDGSSNAGAGSGNMSSGTASRDKNGNGGSANAGSAGEVATADGSSGGAAPAGGEAAPLPENAELLDRLGILDDVTTYGVDVLVGMDIPVELLPEPAPEATTSTAPADVNTGGQGSSGAPAGGSTNAASEDGSGKTKDRPRKNKSATDGATADGSSTGSTDGTTATDSATGSDGQQQ